MSPEKSLVRLGGRFAMRLSLWINGPPSISASHSQLSSVVMRMFRLVVLFVVFTVGCAHQQVPRDPPLTCSADASTWTRLANPPQNKDVLVALTKGGISLQGAEGKDVYWFASADGQRVRYCRGGDYGAETTEFLNKDGAWVWDELLSIVGI